MKKIIGFDKPLVAKIDRWRDGQKPPLNFSEAVRRLVEAALQKGTKR